jgi:hypothetical protein
MLPWENGSPPSPEVVPFDAQVIRSAFGVDVSNQHLVQTPSRRLHIRGRDWNVFLLASPFLAAIALGLSWRKQKGASPTLALFLLWCCFLLAATCLGAGESSYRYLHPFSFIGLAVVAFIADVLSPGGSVST